MNIYLLLVICFLTILTKTPQATATTTNNITISPHCQSHCGDLMVPYPFGIGLETNCSLNALFYITCNSSFTPPRAFIRDSNIQVRNISDTQLRIKPSISRKCYNSSAHMVDNYTTWIDLTNLPFSFSNTNQLTVIGCNDYAFVIGFDHSQSIASGCLSLCSSAKDVVGGNCSGNGCCQTSIPKGLDHFTTKLGHWSSVSNYVRDFDPCSYAFLAEENTFKFQGLTDLAFNNTVFKEKTMASVNTVLDWAIGNLGCEHVKNTRDFLCQSNTRCIDSNRGSTVGYRCICREGYEGNPYLHPGCQDIDECQDPHNKCIERCHNTPGSYRCSCPQGYVGDGWKNGSGCSVPSNPYTGRESGKSHQNSQFPAFKFSLGASISGGTLFLVAGSFWLYKMGRKVKDRRRKARFFKLNGGLLVQQQVSSNEGLVEKTKLFTAKELDKATDYFNKNRILGSGGQGTVYKGMLVDGRIVAVKKSTLADKSQLKQFINEVVILSQINHRNVVKLLGCCLETEVPLLVYEYISSGTLFEHIHDDEFPLSWNMRLQIASEVAGALSYLHSAASIPIYHRDIKSTNILLDDRHKAKVCDFGTSRSVSSIDQTHLTTLVKGTFGYLDPEYFQSSQFTEKSDVYSFGVVLVELLTGKKPISLTRSGEYKSLATYFILSMEEDTLYEILDSRVKNEGYKDDVMAVANLANRCLNLNGKNRPTMKEVAAELESIKMLHSSSPIPYNNIERIADNSGAETLSLLYHDSISIEMSSYNVSDMLS